MEERVIALQEKTLELVEDDLIESAILLGGVMISLSMKTDNLPMFGKGSHLESLLIFAKIVSANGEYNRAISYYQYAIAQLKFIGNHIPKPALSRTDSSKSSSKSANLSEKLIKSEASTKYKIAQCLIRMGRKNAALKLLEQITPNVRTANMALTIAQLYQDAGMERPAVTALRAGIRGNPYALQAVVNLLILGESGSAVSTMLTNVTTQNDNLWLGPFLQAHSALAVNKTQEAISALTLLNQLLPDQPHVLVLLACAHLDSNDEETALSFFQRARKMDPKRITSLDAMARLYHQQNNISELNMLAKELMDIDNKKPEPWVAVALYCDLKGDTKSALSFTTKALEMRPDHVYALHLKGHLYLRLDQHEQAIQSYLKAYSLRRDIHSYKGLVNAYIASQKISDALRVAKEALQLMPKDAQAMWLVGRVLAYTGPDGKKKAVKAYTKALKIDPRCDEAAVSLADLCIRQQFPHNSIELVSAINSLTETLDQRSVFYLHSKLGDLHAAARNFDHALTQYHVALSLNAEYEPARIGLEKLEQLMRGIGGGDMDDDFDHGNYR